MKAACASCNMKGDASPCVKWECLNELRFEGAVPWKREKSESFTRES